MANAKFLDQTGLTHFKGKIDGELAKKANVSAIPSNVSQLTNDSDYQTGTQVSGSISSALEPYAQKTELFDKTFNSLTGKPTINGVEVKGTLTTESLKISIPRSVSELTNDSGFQTSSQVSSAIASAVADITGFEFKVLGNEEELPREGKKGTIYLKPIGGSEDKNIHEEYIWIGNKYEKLGTTAVDLSEYFNTSNLTAISTGDIDAMFA